MAATTSATALCRTCGRQVLVVLSSSHITSAISVVYVLYAILRYHFDAISAFAEPPR